jgi:hypothetical protein
MTLIANRVVVVARKAAALRTRRRFAPASVATGIPPSVLARGGRDGHFGLIGMRERAERIGGTLSIDSGAGKGTDVILTIPAPLAYAERIHGWRSHLPWRYSRERRERMDANG